MNWTRIALFMDVTAAELVRGRLAKVGVRAELQSGPLVARLWFVSRRERGLRLEVPVNESETAAFFLHQWEDGKGVLQAAIQCPGCGSLRVDFPQFTEKSIFTNIAMGLAAEAGLIERGFYCEDCHNTWAKPALKDRRRRAHMAPNYFLEDIQ